MPVSKENYNKAVDLLAKGQLALVTDTVGFRQLLVRLGPDRLSEIVGRPVPNSIENIRGLENLSFLFLLASFLFTALEFGWWAILAVPAQTIAWGFYRGTSGRGQVRISYFLVISEAVALLILLDATKSSLSLWAKLAIACFIAALLFTNLLFVYTRRVVVSLATSSYGFFSAFYEVAHEPAPPGIKLISTVPPIPVEEAQKGSERQAAKLAVTRCLQSVGEEIPQALKELRGSFAPGLHKLPDALGRPGNTLRLGLVVLGIENQALPNTFPLAQARRLRALTDVVVEEASKATNAGVAASQVLKRVDDAFQSAVELKMNPSQAVAEVLCKELGIPVLTLEGGPADAEPCGPIELMLLGAMLVSLTQGLWKQIAGEGKLEPEVGTQASVSGPEGRATGSPKPHVAAAPLPNRVDDEPVDRQRKSIETLIPVWMTMTRPISHPSLIHLIGSDLDEVPDAQGKFGLDARNPILANGPKGEVMYLERLQAASGAKVLYHRLGQAKTTPIEGLPVDAFEVISVDGSKRGILFFLMYSQQRSRKAPDGFQLRPWSSLSDIDKAFVQIGGCGVTTRVDPFPAALPNLVFAKLKEAGLDEPAARLMSSKLEGVVARLS